MITTERTINIYKGRSKIDETVILYRGDFEVQVKFKITNSKFRFLNGVNVIENEEACFGQLAILTPYGGNIFSDISACVDGAVSFTITKEMINELTEVGLYSFQIRLFDEVQQSRVTIPPVEFGIEIREPIAAEDHTDEMGDALVGYMIANIEAEENAPVGSTFDEEGNYNKTVWESGMRVSANRLNKIEDAIDVINQNEMSNREELNAQMISNFNVLQSEFSVQIAALQGSFNVEIERINGELANLEELVDQLVFFLQDSEGNYLLDIDEFRLIEIV